MLYSRVVQDYKVAQSEALLPQWEQRLGWNYQSSSLDNSAKVVNLYTIGS